MFKNSIQLMVVSEEIYCIWLYTVYKKFHKALLAFSKRVVIVLSCAMFLKKK